MKKRPIIPEIPGNNRSWSEDLIALLDGRRGHFQMESGYHSDQWFELGHLFDNPDRLRPFAAELARRFRGKGVEAVCGPMSGGARLAEMVGREMGVGHFVAERFVRAEARGLYPVQYQIPSAQREKLRGKSVAIVDDAVSAGSAVRGAYADLLACGARPVVVGALFVFGDAVAPFAAGKGLALEGMARLKFGMWQPADCPLCGKGIALEKISDAAGARK